MSSDLAELPIVDQWSWGAEPVRSVVAVDRVRLDLEIDGHVFRVIAREQDGALVFDVITFDRQAGGDREPVMLAEAVRYPWCVVGLAERYAAEEHVIEADGLYQDPDDELRKLTGGED